LTPKAESLLKFAGFSGFYADIFRNRPEILEDLIHLIFFCIRKEAFSYCAEYGLPSGAVRRRPFPGKSSGSGCSRWNAVSI